MNNRYQIKTPSGYQSFYGIRKLTKDKNLKIELSNNKTIICSDNHPFISNNDIRYASDLKIGDSIDSINPIKVYVVSITPHNIPTELYDIIQVDNGNIFEVDGIISHNCSFESDEDTVINSEIIQQIYTELKEPIERTGINDCYWYWEKPKPNTDYIVAADVGRGDGSDFSGFHVIDSARNMQVAEFKGAISPAEYGRFLVEVAKEWNDALLIIENTGLGYSTVESSVETGYERLYYSQKGSTLIDVNTFINKRMDLIDTDKLTPGFTNSSKTRPLIIEKLRSEIEDRSLTIVSSRTYHELQVFVWLNGKAQAKQGNNDDLIMALAIALWIRDFSIRVGSVNKDMSMNMMKSFTKTTPFIPVTKSAQIKTNPYMMQIGNKRESIMWVL